MNHETVEDYLGAIYRLWEGTEMPVPLARLQEYFGFSPISIHEMVQKLAERALVIYQPYRGVTLTAAGQALAEALLRRHRLWERFLTDWLAVPWDEVHEIAGALEHAAPQRVTERLAQLLGEPERCPHGAPIPPCTEELHSVRLSELPPAAMATVVQINPESPDLLRRLGAVGITPGVALQLLEYAGGLLTVVREGVPLTLETALAQVIWVAPEKNE